MADKNINIHVRAKGTDEAKQGLDGVAKKTEELGQTTAAAGSQSRHAAGATDGLAAAQKKQQGILGGLIGKFGAWAAGLVGVTAVINAVTRAIQAQTRAMEENAAATLKQQNAILRLQYLGDLFKERPELRKEVGAAAEYGRRPFEQVADAWYNLRSKSAGMDNAQQMGILKEALEMGRTDPSLPLDTLVDMFSLYAKQSGDIDANRIQNVLQKTIEEAGGSGADVAKYMPQFLSVGMSGGLTPAQASGLWAYTTTQTAEASIATTGLRASFMGLQGKGSTGGQALLDKYGVTEKMNFFDKIQRLAGAKISLADAEQIAGREGASVFLSLLKNPEAMMRTVGNVVGADRGDVDLTGAKIAGLMGSDPIAKTEEDVRLLELAIENERAASGKEAAFRRRQLIIESVHRQMGLPEDVIGMAQKVGSSLKGIGIDITGGWDDPEFIKRMKELGWKSPLTMSPAEGGNPNVTINNYASADIIYQQPDQPSRSRFGPDAVEN